MSIILKEKITVNLGKVTTLVNDQLDSLQQMPNDVVDHGFQHRFNSRDWKMIQADEILANIMASSGRALTQTTT